MTVEPDFQTVHVSSPLLDYQPKMEIYPWTLTSYVGQKQRFSTAISTKLGPYLPST
jgi:hypothetical protein